MNTLAPKSYRVLIALFAVAVLLLTACQPGTVTTNPQPAQPTTAATQPAAQPAATQPPAQPGATQPAAPAPSGQTSVTLNTSAVAQSATVETVAAVPASAGGPGWETMPQYTRLTLQGYPITSHLMKPQIFVYPVSELAAYNEAAGKMATDLQALLQSQQVGDRLPFLPLFNAAQVMHAHVQFLDFKGGKGVRFLTQFDQAPIPINNFELIYTFQGLTSDGKYYVAAVLPVNQPEMPVDMKVGTPEAQQMNDFLTYLKNTVEKLNQQPDSSFTPDLTKLDALMQSIEVK